MPFLLSLCVLAGESWHLPHGFQLFSKLTAALGRQEGPSSAASPYQQVIEKSKSLSFRSQMLAMNIEKKLNQDSRSEAPNWAAQDFGFYRRTVQKKMKETIKER